MSALTRLSLKRRLPAWLAALTTVAWTAIASAQAIISPPEFSHAAGFHPNTFMLRLYHPDAGVGIYYTLDGSMPRTEPPFQQTLEYKTSYQRSPKSADGTLATIPLTTHHYRSPIKMARAMTGVGTYAGITTTYGDQPVTHLKTAADDPDRLGLHRIWDEFLEFSEHRLTGRPVPPHSRAANGFIDKAVVVRAVAVGPQGIKSEVVTQTYFFGNSARFPLPILAVTADPRDLFSHETGVMVAGKRFDAWRRRAHRFTATAGTADANWQAKGEASERRIHLEWFSPGDAGASRIPSMNAGLRIHGAFSRAAPNKSFRIHAKKRYGAERVTLPLDFGRPFAPKQIIVRNSGNDRTGTLFRDAVLQRVLDGLKAEVSRSIGATVFINGEYWGIYNLRERLSEDHFAEIAQTKDSNILLEQNFGVKRKNEGLDPTWTGIISALERAGSGMQAEAKRHIDLDSFIDHYIANIYAANVDWPFNNTLAWKVRDAQAAKATAGFATWHWAMHDLDAAFLNPESLLLTGLLSEVGPRERRDLSWSTLLFRTLMKDPGFRKRFFDRFIDLLNTQFQSARVTRFIEDYAQTFQQEIPHHIARWESHKNVDAWRGRVDGMKQFAEARPAHLKEEIQAQAKLGDIVEVSVHFPKDVTLSLVQVNDLATTPDASNAIVLRHFRGRQSSLRIATASCITLSGWNTVQPGVHVLHVAFDNSRRIVVNAADNCRKATPDDANND